MLLFFFLAVFDSLPPVPEPAALAGAEPVIRADIDRDYLGASVFFGEYYGGALTYARSGFILDAAYQHDEKWLAGADGHLKSAVALPFKPLWLQPFVDGRRDKRAGDFRRYGTGINAALSPPWFIIMTSFRFDHWRIPGIYNEATGNVSVFLDRLRILPQVEFGVIYRAGDWETSGAARLHSGNFHIGIGSSFAHNFPAPRLAIEYSTPRMGLEIGIQEGKIVKPLAFYFDPDKPYRYSVPLPAENLHAGIDFKARLVIGPFKLGGDGGIFRWQSRLAPDDSFYLNLMPDVEELRVNFFISGAVNIMRLKLRQVLYIRYDQAHPTIPGEPKYSILDTLALSYGPVYADLGMKYVTDREGINRTLPGLILIDSRIGGRYRSFKVFCAIYNLANARPEIFDGYYPGSRRIAGGIGWDL